MPKIKGTVHIREWAPFIKASGVTDEQLVVSANVVNSPNKMCTAAGLS